jgi:hypothetical protein
MGAKAVVARKCHSAGAVGVLDWELSLANDPAYARSTSDSDFDPLWFV